MFFETFKPKRARNGPTISFFKIYGKSTGRSFLIFLMNSQQHKRLKLITETFFEMCYTGDFRQKKAHGFCKKIFGGIVNYSNIKVENGVK